MGRGSLKVSKEGIEKAKKALGYRGLTQKALGEELGISRSTISNFFNNKNVDRRVFEEVCHRLELDWQEIFEKPFISQEESEGRNPSQQLEKQQSYERELQQEETRVFVPKFGTPFQAPPLPSHFVDRPEVSEDLKQRLIADSTNNSGTLVISAIQGLGGIGKTILAQALAHDSQVQERFCDGILWATLGQQPDILSLLQDWIFALKDHDYKPTTVKAASSHLNSLLYDKAVLLVIDDGWNVEDIEPFRVGSGNCQVIITTRRADVAEEVDAQLYSLDLMSEEQSLTLLARRLGRELADEEKGEAQKLAAAVGYLPIALDLAAARVARGKPWSDLNSALTAENAHLEVLEGVRRRSKKETRLEASFNLSLNFLREDFPEAWESFVWLGVLPEDVSIAAPMVATLWQVEVSEAADRLELFWNDALLLPGINIRINNQNWKTYRIHDLLHNLAMKWLTQKKGPGLGLTISQAHSKLLQSYKKKLVDESWHKLLDDGYIHDHLTWHMEKAMCVDSIHQLLQEETKFGKNAWHSVCESLGKTNIFFEDVMRARKLAGQDFSSNPTLAIGLQCRYSLIMSSLNKIAGNIPPELISILLERKIWTSAQALAYSRQVQSLPQRVRAFSKLASYFPEIWSEALETVQKIGDDSEKANALSFLAPHLPKNLIPQALETVQKIEDDSERANALSSLAPHLPKNLTSQALEISQNLGDEYKLADALSFLAPHLPKNLIPQALETVQKIEDDSERANALSSLAPHLPKNLIPQALEISQNLGDEYNQARVLCSLASHLPEIWSETLEKVRNIEVEYNRAIMLSSLAPNLPELYVEAFDTAKKIADEYNRADMLISLAPHLPESLIPQFLDASKYISNEKRIKFIRSNISNRVRVLRSLPPHLPESLVPQFLDIIKNLGGEFNRANLLLSLAPHLPKHLIPQALEIAQNIKNNYDRARVLSLLAPHLSEIRLEALEVALNIGDESQQADILSSLAPYLPDDLLLKTLEVLQNLGDEFQLSNISIISSLAPHLPNNLLLKTLETAHNLGDKSKLADLLNLLASYLPKNLLPQALEKSRTLDSESERVRIICSIAPNLPGNLLPEALEEARKIGDESERAKVLSSLASNLPENLVPEALKEARKIRDESERARVLSHFAAHMPEICSEALEAARNLGFESERVRILSFLVPHLPENLVPEALEAAQNLSFESDPARILSSLAPHLSKNLVPRALEAARNLSSESDRAKVFGSLALHLAEIWSEALEAVRKIRDESERVKILCSFAPNLPENLVPEALEEARKIRNEYERARVLSHFAAHIPEICSEALEAARNLGFESERVRILSFLVPHLPENLVPRALEAAINLGFESDRARVLSLLTSHMPENLLPKALEISRNLSSESDRARVLMSLALNLPEIYSEALDVAGKIGSESEKAIVLSQLISNLNNIFDFDSDLYIFWCKLIPKLASLERGNILDIFLKNSHIIKKIGGLGAFREIANAVEDVGKWFP